MLDTKIVELSRKRSNAERANRADSLDMGVTQIFSEMNARGVLHSTMTAFEVGNLCANELQIRTLFAYQYLLDVFQKMRGAAYAELAFDLKQEMKISINADAIALNAFADEKLRNTIQRGAELAGQQISKRQVMLLDKFNAELELFVETLMRQSSEHTVPGGTRTINVFGTVGAIQIGDSANANVQQGFASADVEKLRALFQNLPATIETSNLSLARKSEILAVVREAAEETHQVSPNNTKLMGALVALASGIQGIASAQPAYQTIRAMLLPFGVMLP